MGITTKIEKGSNLRMHVVTNNLTKSELISELNKLYSEPDFRSDMDVFWDLTNADLSSFSSEQINQVKDLVGNHWGQEGKSRAALVAKHDLTFGLSKMYQTLLESITSSEVKIFRDHDEALKWIQSDR